jgi:hypothetical protein
MRGCFSLLWKAVLGLVLLFVLIVVFVPAPAKVAREAGGEATVATIEATVFVVPTATTAWYSGGTLHNSTVAEWKAATDANRLATAADWATSGMDLTLPSEIEHYAHELMVCVNEAVNAYPQDAETLDIAVACAVMLSPR